MKAWWVPGLQIGYEHTFIHQVADFLKALQTGEPCRPTFRDALETQRVCDAVLHSAKTNCFEQVAQGSQGAGRTAAKTTTAGRASGKDGRRNQREQVASASNGGGRRNAGGGAKRVAGGRRQGKR
jgi:hypothetical protein